ncbi:hypothetical protein LQ564_00815 [Massilia sp. G4R7]|uniref:Uncharacterized protein n=1 Tax=Massilia phyllostachyos TaxID=2898585 RepID=A0ABS8Q2H5_9BURK|nr:hypothetical protein [Massilia phyllostachyos]MCD2514850.1 hypothetical protein [Massilia phyllostachyos]
MNLHELEESDVLTISLDQAHRRFDMVLRTEDGKCYALSAWNQGATRIDITFGEVHIRANLTNRQSMRVLGELESIGSLDGVLVLEGDFGDITIKADTVSVRKLD